jgi:Family of unknown function (DUF5906)
MTMHVIGEAEIESLRQRKAKNGYRDKRNTVILGGALKHIVTLDDLNSRYAILQARGSASIYVSRDDFLPIQDCDLKRRLACEVVITGDKDGTPVYGAAFPFWTGHAARHVYRNVVFTSEPVPETAYNLYRGLGVRPAPGNCAAILAHVHEVICLGDDAVTRAVLDLLAWQIQNIGKPSRVVVILKSEKHQAGKGLLLGDLMGKIYGDGGFTPSSVAQILGRLNDAIRGRSFLFLDEVLFAGDRRAADGVKRLSTATEIGIETKGLPVVRCPVAVNLWLASNHENAAHIEEHDARYWVLEVSEERIGDSAYFDTLAKEIETGGREAFAHFLLNRDVTNFVPCETSRKIRCPNASWSGSASIRSTRENGSRIAVTPGA